MGEIDLLSVWVTLTPSERVSVREVYFHQHTVDDTATRYRASVPDMGRALQSAYRRIAPVVEQSDLDMVTSSRSNEFTQPWATLAATGMLTAWWQWDTSLDQMLWSDSMYALYGYPVGAVRPTIAVHQAHKHHEDRAAVQQLVVTSATQAGAVVFPQRVVRTNGDVVHVVMRVRRQPGPGEVLVAEVVANAGTGS